MSRIYDKNVPQDLIKLGGISMERKFLDALVKELVEIMGLPEDNSIRNLLKHSLHKFLINDETMRCTRITAEGLIPDPIYPRGLLNEYEDYVLDKDKAWKEFGEAFNAEYKAKAAEKAEAEKKNVPENGGAEGLKDPDHKEVIPGTDKKASDVLLQELTKAEVISEGLILSNDEWIEAIRKVGSIQRNLLKDKVPPSAADLFIVSRLRDVEEVLKDLPDCLIEKDILQAMDYVSTIKLNLEQRNLGSLNQPESSMKKPKRKYRGK